MHDCQHGLGDTHDRSLRLPDTHADAFVQVEEMPEGTEESLFGKSPSPKELFPELPAEVPPPKELFPELPAEVPPPSQGALDRRIRRALAPSADGSYKVAQQIRKLWAEGNKTKVFKLFAECGNDADKFIKKYSVRHEQTKEHELGVFFAFKSEEELESYTERLDVHFCSFKCQLVDCFIGCSGTSIVQGKRGKT